MDYFVMRQDPRVRNVAKPEGARVNELRHLTRAEIDAISIPPNLYVKNSKKAEYTDYIEEPVMLLSEKLKKIMSKYQKDAIFKAAILMGKDTSRQETYYLISAPGIRCASEGTTYDTRGNVKDLVIDKEKVVPARIFFTEGYERRIIVRLDVAESILRRDPNGIWFEKVKAISEREEF